MNPMLFFILFIVGAPIAALIATVVLVFGVWAESATMDDSILLPMLIFIGSPLLFLMLLYVFWYLLWTNRHREIGRLLAEFPA